MAADAARRLQALVAEGAEIPYELQGPTEGSPLCQYVPLTERFVRDHAEHIKTADSFGVACAAIESAGLAVPYLEEFGIDVPPNPQARAELAAIVFLCRLWMDATEFTTDRHRIDSCIEEMESFAETGKGEIEIVAALRGFQANTSRIDVDGMQIVRADHYEEPPHQLLTAESAGVAGWAPPYLASIHIDGSDRSDDPDFDPAGEALTAFEGLVSALRLFRPGGVSLGQHAWIRFANGSWQRMNTGASKARSSGYRLADSEAADFADFAARFNRFTETLDPATPLARAIVRFETALDRETPLDMLNDFMISLRSLFEGGGPAKLGFAQRLAAIVATPADREEVRRKVDRAVAMERELWSGAAAGPTSGITECVSDLEDLLRRVLCMAVRGDLGTDLRAVADEILLADGFGIAARPAQPAPAAEDTDDAVEDIDVHYTEDEDYLDTTGFDEPVDHPIGGPVNGPAASVPAPAATIYEIPTQEMKVFAAERRITETNPVSTVETATATSVKEKTVLAEASSAIYDRQADLAPAVTRTRVVRLDDDFEPDRMVRTRPTSDLVRRLMADRAQQRAEIADRVAGLFPRPEPTEWNVPDLNIERALRRPLASSAYYS